MKQKKLLLWWSSMLPLSRSDPITVPYISGKSYTPPTIPSQPGNDPSTSSYPWNGHRDVSEEDPRCPLSFTVGLSHSIALSSSSSPIVSSPHLLHDPRSNQKSILYNTLTEHLDMLHTAPQTKLLENPSSFPLLFESSVFKGGVNVRDANDDGIEEAILVDYDGRMFFVGLEYDTETKKRSLEEKQVPRLVVRHDWFDRLDEKEGTEEEEKRGYGYSSPLESYFEYDDAWMKSREEKLNPQRGVTADLLQQDVQVQEARRENVQEIKDGKETSNRRRLQEEEVDSNEKSDNQETNAAVPSEESQPEESQSKESQPEEFPSEESQPVESQSKESQPEESQSEESQPEESQSEESQPDEVQLDASQELGIEMDHGEDYNYNHHYDDHIGYDDLVYAGGQGRHYSAEDHINIDPHILATAALVELPEYFSGGATYSALVIPVSYYFDEDEVEEQSFKWKMHSKEFNDVDSLNTTEKRGRYVASAIMVYHLESKYWVLQQHLDLSTSPSAGDTHGAFITVTPTVVDLEGDGSIEIIVGTHLGYLHVIHAHLGTSKPNFPLRLEAPIASKVVVANVIGDDDLEMIVLDQKGNLICVDAKGQVLWQRTLNYQKRDYLLLPGEISLGDINGDGVLDLVVIIAQTKPTADTTSPNDYHSIIHIHALNSLNGQNIMGDHFPISIDITTSFPVTAPPPAATLIDLHQKPLHHWANTHRKKHNADQEELSQRKNQQAKMGMARKKAPHGGAGIGLHILLPTMDGYVYIIEGGTGCTNRLPIGFPVAAPVAVGNIHPDGTMSLIVPTMDSILTFNMPSLTAHPMNSWSEYKRGVGPQGSSADHGILVTGGGAGQPLESLKVNGVLVPLTFEIFDKSASQRPQNYTVVIRAGSSYKRLLLSKTYNTTGVYSELFHVPQGPGHYSLIVSLVTDHGLRYEHTISLSYNVDYYQGLDWLLVFPLILLGVLPLVFFKKKEYDLDDSGAILGR